MKTKKYVAPILIFTSSFVIPTYCSFPSKTNETYCSYVRPYIEPEDINKNISNKLNDIFNNGKYSTVTTSGTALSDVSTYPNTFIYNKDIK